MAFDIEQRCATSSSARARTSTSRCPRHRSRASTASSHPIEGVGARCRPRTPRRRSARSSPPGTGCEEFARDGEVDFSYTVRGPVALPRQRLPPARLDLDRLPRDPVPGPHDRRARAARGHHATLAEEPRGIILVTGTTGSGKSTTLAAMIDHINSTRPRHIVTIEDPIEYLHRDQHSIIHQREVGFDTDSFARAMRRVLRQDPDVILIGEMRDEETVRTALSRRRDRPPRALDAAHDRRGRDDQPDHRLLPAAPPAAGARDARLDAARRDLAAPRAAADGDGRVAACEVLVVDRPRPRPDPQPRGDRASSAR